MEFLTTNANLLIEAVSAGAKQTIEEGGGAAQEGLGSIGRQVEALKGAITTATRCQWVTRVVRFVDGIAVAIILVTILQTLRSKHRLIPGAASDAFNKLGNLIGVPKHSADVMRHLKQLGMMFVGVLVLRMIVNSFISDCADKLVEETILLQRVVAANVAVKTKVDNVIKAMNNAIAKKKEADAKAKNAA